MTQTTKHPSIFSLTLLSVGTMIGSGWLFSGYYSAKQAGSLSIFSWIIGAAIMLLMALLLCELAIKFPKKNGLFTNLISLSHNPHMGFMLSVVSWLLGLVVVSSEAIATVQYLSGLHYPFFDHLFRDNHLTIVGIGFSIFFMCLYTVFNFWGVQLLAKANNLITIMKIGIPVLIALLLMWAARPLHLSNYSWFAHMGHIHRGTALFSAIVNSGIFYSFFGFQAAASFATELRNPEKSLPIALMSSIGIVLFTYLILQVAFIGVVPAHMLNHGWAGLEMSSPLAQLSVLLGLNFLSILIYVNSAISPSGTALVYMGVIARVFNEMVQDGQMPGKRYAEKHSEMRAFRLSLLIACVIASISIFFFSNWQMITSLMTTFILLACIGLPIGHARLRQQEKGFFAKRFIPFPQFISWFLFLLFSYLLLISGFRNIIVAASIQLVLYVLYALTKRNAAHLSFVGILRSASSLLAYLLVVPIFSWMKENYTDNVWFYLVYCVIMTGLYYSLVHQKNFCLMPSGSSKLVNTMPESRVDPISE